MYCKPGMKFKNFDFSVLYVITSKRFCRLQFILSYNCSIEGNRGQNLSLQLEFNLSFVGVQARIESNSLSQCHVDFLLLILSLKLARKTVCMHAENPSVKKLPFLSNHFSDLNLIL